jgi:cation:H+ antiporter
LNPLPEILRGLGLDSPWGYLGLFLAASLLMVWRMEGLLAHGLEGTALGTLVMPYCSGLGNLVLVALVAGRPDGGAQIVTNALVNNVTNLTLLLGLPALLWGLPLGAAAGRGRAAKSGGAKGGAEPEMERQLNRVSIVASLGAGLFFTGLLWVLGEDGRLDLRDGLVLTGAFLFWQALQVADVLKHNVRRRRGFGPAFYLDLVVVGLGAAGVYTGLDWLVSWLGAQTGGGLLDARHLGWLSGWLLVLPNALLAFYYAARGRGAIAYASQVGDGHICIPLGVGLAALVAPVTPPPFFGPALAVLAGAGVLHAGCVLLVGGLPRAIGWVLVAGYGAFLLAGWAN